LPNVGKTSSVSERASSQSIGVERVREAYLPGYQGAKDLRTTLSIDDLAIPTPREKDAARANQARVPNGLALLAISAII
jgi:hypothetical protein